MAAASALPLDLARLLGLAHLLDLEALWLQVDLLALHQFLLAGHSPREDLYPVPLFP
jgi:hypothetical protein